MCQFKHEKGNFFHAKCRKVVVASNAIVLLFALRLLGIKSPIPCNAEQALRLCRRSRRMRRCPSAEKAVDLSDGAGVSAFRLQYIPLYNKRSCLGGITIDSQTEPANKKSSPNWKKRSIGTWVKKSITKLPVNNTVHQLRGVHKQITWLFCCPRQARPGLPCIPSHECSKCAGTC